MFLENRTAAAIEATTTTMIFLSIGPAMEK